MNKKKQMKGKLILAKELVQTVMQKAGIDHYQILSEIEGKDLEGKGFDPRKLLAPGCEAIKAKVKEKMELFGSVNKA